VLLLFISRDLDGIKQADPRNRTIGVPGDQQSNRGELVAVIVALQETPHFHPLVIILDLKYAIEGLTMPVHSHNWEDQELEPKMRRS